MKVKPPRLSDLVSFVAGAAAAIAITLAFNYGFPRLLSSPDGAAALLCCIRGEQNPDTASSIFQQNVATAVTNAGLKIRHFSAPRPARTGSYRQLTAIVTAEGSSDEIKKALASLAAIQPNLAVASAEIAPAASGAEELRLTLAQWNN